MAKMLMCSILLFGISLASCRLTIDVDDFMKLAEKVDRLERRNAELEKEVKAVKAQSATRNRRFMFPDEPPVAFTAGLSNIVDHLGPHQRIVFETVVTTVGRGYDNTTGMFTAPFSGIYVFSCSLIDHMARSDGTGVMLHAEIVKNGNVLGRIFAHAEGSSYRDQGAQTVFVNVNQGEKVWVRIMDSTNLTVGGELYSTFSGYLLYQTN